MIFRRRNTVASTSRDAGDRIFILEDLATGAKTYVPVAAADVERFQLELELVNQQAETSALELQR